MMLYHGTAARNVPDILKRGIVPRGDATKSNWDVESARDRVYLTTVYAPYFAHCAADDGEDAAILEIDTDQINPGLFVPDEDFLEQASRGKDFEDVPWAEELAALGNDMTKRTHWFRDHIELFQHSWELSIKTLGTVAVAAGVPADAIRRVSRFSPSKNKAAWMQSLDPSITLMNYRFVGDKYRALTEWFMGAPVTPELVGRVTFYAQYEPPSDEVIAVFSKREVEVVDVTV